VTPRHTSLTRHSRRAFVRRFALAGLGLAAVPLAACAPIQPPTPTLPAPGQAAPQAPAQPAAVPRTDSPAAASPAAAAPAGSPAAAAPAGSPAAAAPGASPAAGAPKPAAPAAAQAPAVGKPGGVLRLIQSSDVAPREPHLLLGGNAPIALSVWDTLIRFDRNLQAQPVLAEKWEWSPDYKTLTMQLRSGVTFHSGRELTSEDVEFNITRVREPAVGSQMRGSSLLVKTIERPDKLTIRLGFETPYGAIFDMLDTLVIVDRETVGDIGSGKVIGTGPFLWKEWVPEQRCVLEKNPKYWQAGTPLVDRIETTVIGDIQSMAVQFEAGQHDAALRLSAQDFVRLRNDPKYQAVVMESGSGYVYVAADVTRAPLDKKEVRQAINLAINRTRFNQTAMNGIGRATTLPWPTFSPAYDEALAGGVAFDLERAKALLAQAGLSGGFEMPITFSTQRQATNGKLVEILQSDLGQIGVKLQVQSLENSVFQRTLNEGKFNGLFTHGHGFSNRTPAALFVQAFPFRAQNASNFTSPEYTRLTAAMQTEADEAKLKSLYGEMNRLLLDEAFIMDVSTDPGHYVAKGNVQGLDYNLQDWWVLHRASIS
jgi:peptide/nickel transport system substrate-binding protein